MRKRGRAVALLTVLVGALLGGAWVASASPPPPDDSAVVAPDGVVVHAGRWMVDGRGRVVVVHGVNMPTKTLPAYPAALGFSDDDAALLAASGFNAVRLTVERYAVEPTAGQFDDAYVSHIGETVALLRQYGISSLIDFHQDEYGPMFNDNGFPDWMTMTDGLPNVTEVGFPGQYFLNPALNRAFDHFWANDIGPDGKPLQQDDADILAHVAQGLASQDGLLGYEIMNEPWPGTQYPTCLTPEVGCPAFDRGAYSAYHARVIAALRAADPVHMIWYEPLTTFNQGVPTSMVPPPDPRLGFAFHDYPLCSAATGAVGVDPPAGAAGPCATEDSLVMANAEAHSAATGSALLETEFGASMDLAGITQQLARFDSSMMPWMFWSYTRYIDPYASDGTLVPATAANVDQAMLNTLARPYPELVAGTPAGWAFDPDSKTFTFQYSPSRADGQGSFEPDAETDVAVPRRQYPDGYRVTITGGTVASDANAPILRVRAASGPGPITVVLAPAGAAAATNSSCPAGATPLAGGAAVSSAGAPTDSEYRETGCLTGTGVADGTVTVGRDPAKPGYVVQDGQPGNPSLLGGYLGVDRQDTLTVVGCAGGDYDPNAPDEWNQSPTSPTNNAMAALGRDTFTAPAGPVGPSSPCSPMVIAPSAHGPCGAEQDPSPAVVAPGGASPLNVYASPSGRGGDVGIAGNFGGNRGASGVLQATVSAAGTGSTGDVTVGGTSKGGGGTVSIGNDGQQSGDMFTPAGTPIAVCQN